MPAGQQVAQGVVVEVEHAEGEERLAVGLPGEAQEGLHPVLARGVGQRLQAALGARRVVGALAAAHGEDLPGVGAAT